ncbi:major facilitator superfamily domain-containing protein [Zychaea mexicana]|uniref:major facilitator superfamily domain-containing protein n=1 Tax=Zychaea mexicana TaxID=64656 RepID=UPI0022FDE74D|nr:major facilitator superfamily domain-containing protein [Zychaea mexicana]KAI9494405.1 major facilitator superfamily domain-containing protein [Zychaea mexicana]
MDEHDPQNYREYPIRFYGLAVIGLLNIASSLSWLSIAPVPQQAAEFFGGTSYTVINWFSNVFMLSYLIAGPISSIVYERYSIKIGLVLGAGLQVLGSWLRFFSVFVDGPSGRLALAIVGQIICAIGQPFILSSSTPYAALWFSADGRGSATTVSGLTNAVGMAIASVTGPAFVTNEFEIRYNFLFVACFTTAFAIPAIFIPRKPKTPPSYSASNKNVRQIPFWQSIRMLFTNFQYIIIWLSFGVMCGLFSTISSLLAQILLPYGISEDDAGIAAVALIIAGIVGAVASGIFIDKTQKHVWVLKSFVPVVGFMYLALLMVVKPDNYGAIVGICAIMGFFTFSLLPVALELSVECSYPVSESISSPLLWLCSQILAFVFTISMDALRDPDGDPPENMRRALIMATGFSMPMMVLVLFYNSKSKRLATEEAATDNMNRDNGFRSS